MTRRVWLAFLLVLAACDGAQDLEILRTSHDSAQVEQSAIAVVRSRDPKAIAELSRLLEKREFLARLDDLANPQRRLFHLHNVFAALEATPSPASESLCLTLAANPEFTAEPVRLNYLLAALAAVRPMSEPAAALFRTTNTEGYFTVNGPLLVANGSPRALQLFESMMADPSVDAEQRIDVIRRSVLPYRTRLPVLHTVEHLLGRGLDTNVQVALLQSVFDYRSREWFGVERNPPKPPEWSSASPETLAFVVELGKKQERRKDLPDSIEHSIKQTVDQISALAKH